MAVFQALHRTSAIGLKYRELLIVRALCFRELEASKSARAIDHYRRQYIRVNNQTSELLTEFSHVYGWPPDCYAALEFTWTPTKA